LVIDNAQHCHDLDSLSFVLEAAQASPTVSVILIGSDQPAFLSAIRSHGIVDWRLPGLTEEEARVLVELTVGQLSDLQLSALEFLRSRVDGHLGMLKLSGDLLPQIKSEEERDAFVVQISSALSPGLDSLQSAMVERLREGLSDDELELCRRLSIVVGAFARRVGEHLWALDRPAGAFSAAWNGCVLRVLEGRPSGKYSLPDLYRDGLRQEADRNAVQSWHSAAADAFEDTRGASVDVFEVHAAVLHRFLGGNVTAALQSASMYLAFATGPHARTAQAFLIRRFQVFLGGPAADVTVPVTQRIRWYSVCTRVYADLSLRDEADTTAQELHDLLCTVPPGTAVEAIQLGWGTVLMHASRSGRPELAASAIGRLEQTPVTTIEDTPFPWAHFLVISAYLTSSTDPLPYLRTMLNARRSDCARRESLWGGAHGYEFWRAVAAGIYWANADCETDTVLAAQLADAIKTLADDCLAVSEVEIACLMQCLLVHVEIDLLRNFERACDTANRIIALADEIADVRVAAYLHATRGDSLRCTGLSREAQSEYSHAIRLWPDAELPDKADALLMLGICQARLGQFREGTKSARAAARLWSQAIEHTGGDTAEQAAARCLLEAAGFATHGTDYSIACHCLTAVHDLLKDANRDTPEWVALAQVAWSLENRLKPDPLDPQPPVSGFTLALGEGIAGADTMESTAPTLMVARACAAVGQSRRALTLYGSLLADIDAPGLRVPLAIMALDAAIQAQDLARAAEYAAIGSDWLVQAPPGVPGGAEAFVFDYLIGRTVQLALVHQDQRRAITEIDRAVSALDGLPTDNPAIRVLCTTLLIRRANRAQPKPQRI